MRGPLWRGWLWSPRIYLSTAMRRTVSRLQWWEQGEQRARATQAATTARWWHRPWWWLTLATLAVVIAALWTLTQLVLPAIDIALAWLDLPRRPPLPWLSSKHWCPKGQQGSCAKAGDFLGKAVTLALAFVVFFAFTRFHVHNWYLRIARRMPERLVTTSNDTLADITGRDELCEVLIERVRDPDVRCPMVLIGGVGSGKSAVLAKLAHELAARHVLPIPLRMRDVPVDGGEIDFEQAAKKRFADFIDPRLYSDSQADRLWRQLRWSNQIAVLADGLDEIGARTSTDRPANTTACCGTPSRSRPRTACP